MQILLDNTNIRHLKYILRNLPETVTKISAAIAFNQDPLLLNICIQRKITLDWWGLFTSDISTKIDLVRKAIEHADVITFYPFAEHFHSKVIYFHGYGVFIGSHNMTRTALEDNVEAGVFILEKELSMEQKNEIDNFFNDLKSKSLPVTIGDVEKIEQYIEETEELKSKHNQIKEELSKSFKKNLGHLFLLKRAVEASGSTKEEKEIERKEKKKLEFLQEWRETQTRIEYIQTIVKSNVHNPSWIKNTTDYSIITDQILHVYYTLCTHDSEYDEKNIEAVNRKFEENKNRVEEAIKEAIDYWNNLPAPIENEDKYINEWAPANKAILSNLKNRKLTDSELFTVFDQNHSAITHARQMENALFGLPKDYHGTPDDKCRHYVTWIQKQRSAEGLDINDTLKFLLFGPGDIENRVYEVLHNKHYRIEHLGPSVVGELCGWGRADITHLRNNRVNKALRCLGFDVKLFTDD